MTVLLPVIFYCLTNGVCKFDSAPPVTSIEECITQLKQVSVYMQANPLVSAFEADCIDLTKPRKVKPI